MRSPFRGLFAIGSNKTLKNAQRLIPRIMFNENDFTLLTDNELRMITVELKARATTNDAETLMIEAFSAAREAANRSMNKRHTDIHIIGGAILAAGQIAELTTNSDKSLATTLAAYYHVVLGHRVRVITGNEFLAVQQANQMRRMFERLEVSVGYVTQTMTPAEREASYNCDIIYGSIAQFTADKRENSLDFTIASEVEFAADTVTIPSHENPTRQDLDDRLFIDRESKINAVITDVERIRDAEIKPPILICTLSTEDTAEISERLNLANIPHAVLNDKNLPLEASIIAQAGREGRVAIATGTAGRGTDIALGGNIENQIEENLRTTMDKIVRGEEHTSTYDAFFKAQMKHFVVNHEARRERVIKAGGLHVIVAGHHTSPHIDNQLRSRAGHHGEPGSSQFFVSFDDNTFSQNRNTLMKKYAPFVDNNGEVRHKKAAAIIKNQSKMRTVS